MKKNKKNWVYSFVVIGLTLVITNGCTKDSNKDSTTQKEGLIFNPDLSYGTVTDIDGNVYKTITIGTQTWMAENLKVTRYQNGDSISRVNEDVPWSNLDAGAYCIYLNNSDKGAIYGKLYNWYSLKDTRNICPSGWHVPTDAEWEVLYSYLGGYETSTSEKMRETGITHWAYINDDATNESGFTGIPGGMRDYGGLFTDVGQMGFWWSSSPANDYYDLDAMYYYVDNSGVSRGVGSKRNGMSVRCVKD
jgi:uncharacterized protein (TIGR02145 family)